MLSFAIVIYHIIYWNRHILLGEDIISKDAFYSYEYALDILGDRFEMGEIAIRTDMLISYNYSRDVLRGRFKIAEHLFSASPLYSFPLRKIYFA